MSTNSFVVNINETAAKLDMLDELNKKLTQANVDTLLAYDYEPLLTDLNKADSDVVNVSDNMGTIQSVSANMESILAVNGEVDEARSILGSVQAEADTAIASVGTATENAIQAVNQTENSVIQSVNNTKDLAILTVNQTRDEAVNTVGLEVDKAEQSAVNSEASAKRAEAAAEEAASKIGITDTIRPSSEAVNYLAPSEHAVALLKENMSSIEEDISVVSNAVNTNASAIVTNTNAINNIVSSTQKLWKGTQTEFDALSNKDGYFMSYVLNRGTLDKIYQGSNLIFSNMLKRVIIQGTFESDEEFEVVSESAADIYNWIQDNKANLKTIKFIDPYGLFTGFEHLFQMSPSLVSIDFSEYNGYYTEAVIFSLMHMCSSCDSLTSLDLSTFDLSKTFNISNLLVGPDSLTSVTFPSNKIIKPQTADNMITYAPLLTTLDLSSFDFSRAGVHSIVAGCTSLTTCYGRTQADCDKLNASYGKPANVNFIVKP